jgi:5'-3' exonuclease
MSREPPATYAEALKQYQSIAADDGTGHRFRDYINPFADDWETRYYKYFFNIRESPVSQICKDYLTILHWNLQYYYTGCPNWHWYYYHSTAPLLIDMVTYLSITPVGQTSIKKFSRQEPLQPLHQLLMIMPPQSQDLLPKTYHQLMTASNSPLISYFPSELTFETYGKHFRWECHPRIPMINLNKLFSIIPTYDQQLTSDDVTKNRRGTVFTI